MVHCLFEDKAPDFLPLAHFRPVYDLTCGILTMREKWEHALPGNHLRFAMRGELHEHRARPDRLTDAGGDAADWIWLINGTVFPEAALTGLIGKPPRTPTLYTDGDTVVAALLRADDVGTLFSGWTEPLPDFSLLPGVRRIGMPVRRISHFWDLVRYNADEISSDVKLLKKTIRRVKPKDHPGAHFVKGEGIYAGKRCIIKPGAVIDAERGAVVIGSDVTIMPTAVIIGPASVGNGTTIKIGAKIYGGTTIGAHCKVGGEVEASVMLPWSNKQHEGFLGHSYLASWVNLGADTNTSDLKNTYGPVSVLRRGVRVDTGMQFLGLTMGDHSKSGINVMFDTGTVVGVCCNIFGAGLPPKEIPSFSWGGPAAFTPYDPVKGLEVMKIVMARRNIHPGEEYAKTVRETFERTAADRDIAGVH